MATTLSWGLNRLRTVIREPWYTISTYSIGTVTVTAASVTVTGSGTAFLANVKAGQTFHIVSGQYYHILSVDSDTQLTLATAYAITGGSGKAYTITENRYSTTTLVDELNEAQRELVNEIEHKNQNYLATSGKISYIAGQELYTLPSTNGVVKQIINVRRTDLGTEKVLMPIILQDRINWLTSTNATSTDIEEKYYPIGNTQIGILPVPASAITDNITIDYLPEATDLTVDSSTIILPDDFRELWVLTAAIGLTDDPVVLARYQRAHKFIMDNLNPRQSQESRHIREKHTDDY